MSQSSKSVKSTKISMLHCMHYFILKRINSQNLNRNSPHCLPYNSFDISLENLVLDQIIIP